MIAIYITYRPEKKYENSILMRKFHIYTIDGTRRLIFFFFFLSLETNKVNTVQILDETAFISYCANIFWKAMSLIIFYQAMD